MHHLRTWQLFAICVLIWSTTWYAITFQIGGLSPEAGVALRFAIAGLTVLGWRALAGDRLRFGPADHARFALQGAFLYGVSYVAVYHAEKHVVSGLVAVGYSASPLVTGLGAHWLFGVKVTRRFLAGGLLGLAGVVLIFWPDIVHPSGNRDTSLGVMFTVAGVLLGVVDGHVGHAVQERALQREARVVRRPEDQTIPDRRPPAEHGEPGDRETQRHARFRRHVTDLERDRVPGRAPDQHADREQLPGPQVVHVVPRGQPPRASSVARPTTSSNIRGVRRRVLVL